MTPIYLLATGDEDTYKYGALLESGITNNCFTPDGISEADFEQKHHKLMVLDMKERDAPSDKLHDIDEVNPAVFAFSVRAWPLLPALIACGCRVTEDVEVTGTNLFKVVYPGVVVDILDHVNQRGGLVN